jgi:tetratricopeptide (TPR) repeat protein
VEAALSLLEDARAMYEALGDQLGVALSHDALGWILVLGGDEHAALDHFEAALAIQHELENPRLIALAKVAVCMIQVAIGDLKSAEPMAKEILAAALSVDDTRNMYFGYHFSADCALARGDGAEAERLYGESLRAALANADRVAAAVEVEGIAMSNACRGDARRGLRLGGAVEARREELGIRMSPRFWEESRARHFGRAREQWGAAGADAEWAAGRVMGWEAAVAEALGEVPAAEAPDSTR